MIDDARVSHFSPRARSSKPPPTIQDSPGAPRLDADRRAERALVVSTSYPAFEGDPSGHFVRTEARAMARDGAEVHVFAPRVYEPIDPAGPRLVGHDLGGTRLFSWPGALHRARRNPARLVAAASFARALRRSLGDERPFDRAVLHFLVPVAFPLAPALDGVRDVEAIAHGGDVRLLVRAPTSVRRRIVSTLIERATRLRFVASALLEQLASSLDARTASRLEAHATVRPLAIEVPERESLSPPAGALELGRYAVWVGRDIASKRLDAAIDAAARAGVPLVVVGASRAAAGGAVHSLGALPRPEALRWIAAAAVLVSTSREEGAPTAVREARALGVPVVAVQAGDIARWAVKDSGISVTSDDVRAIAGRLRQLVDARERPRDADAGSDRYVFDHSA